VTKDGNINITEQLHFFLNIYFKQVTFIASYFSLKTCFLTSMTDKIEKTTSESPDLQHEIELQTNLSDTSSNQPDITDNQKHQNKNKNDHDPELIDYELRATIFNLFPIVRNNPDIWDKLSTWQLCKTQSSLQN